MNFKGNLILLILHVLSRGPNHGYQIAKTLKLQSQGLLDFKEATLYPVLHSLEAEGSIQSTSRQAGGHLRRYYELTASGKKRLTDEVDAWQKYTQTVNLILGQEGVL